MKSTVFGLYPGSVRDGGTGHARPRSRCADVVLAAAVSVAVASMVSTGVFAAEPLKMATSWGGGPHLNMLAKGFAEKVDFLTNGEIKIEVFPAGTLGSPLKVVETVRNGVADAGHHWSGYDWGVDKTAVLFGGYAGSMPEEHYLHWLYEGGGLDLWQQWRLEKHGVVGFACGSHSDEVFMHSRKRIQSIEDFKGVKLRTSGAWAEIASTLGASTVILAGPDVYPALERGVVDAIEWATPWINHAVGFNKIAKYVILPGLHQASSAQECVFRTDVWDRFTDRQKQLLMLAGKLTTLEAFMKFNDGDVEALRMFVAEGNELVVVDEGFRKAKDVATHAWIEKTKKELGGWFSKVVDSQQAYFEKWSTASLYRSEIR